MAKAIESKLRAWVRQLPGLETDFVEAARGGTDGFPDVLLKFNIQSNDKIYSCRLPVELKSWEILKNGKFAAKLRREQVRFHCVEAKKDMRTLILWNSPSSPGIWCLPGNRAPETVSSQIDQSECFFYYESQKEKFVENMVDGSFWRVS